MPGAEPYGGGAAAGPPAPGPIRPRSLLLAGERRALAPAERLSSEELGVRGRDFLRLGVRTPVTVLSWKEGRKEKVSFSRSPPTGEYRAFPLRGFGAFGVGLPRTKKPYSAAPPKRLLWSLGC